MKPNLIKYVTEKLARAPAVLVTVTRTQGSAPREPGACMVVFPDEVVGTVGGGHVEHEAIGLARRARAGVESFLEKRYVLGPSLGQCCGGTMHLRFEFFSAGDALALGARITPARVPLALFGGGHVGSAIVRALAPLRYAITWIDSRDGIFPADAVEGVTCEHSEPVHGAVRGLLPGSRVLIMSFSHAEDLDIVGACLQRLRERDDLPYVGLIGSKTKWAAFRSRLEVRGFGEADFARVTCPIGVPGIRGKEPEVIAASVAAQLLQMAPPG